MHSNSKIIPLVREPQASDCDVDLTGEKIVEYIKHENIDLTGPTLESENSNPIHDKVQTAESYPVCFDNRDVLMMNYHIKSEETDLMEDYTNDPAPANSIPMEFLNKSHIKTEKHSSIRTIFKCDCGAKFFDKFLHFGHMIDHMLRFTCNTCGLRLYTEEELSNHITYNHKVCCKFCGKHTEYKYLNKHNKEFHPEKVQQLRILYEKRRLARNRFHQEISGFAHHMSQWRWEMDNYYRQTVQSKKIQKKNKKRSKNKSWYRINPNVKIEPNANVKIEPGLVNVKLEPGLVNVKLEPGLVNVKLEPGLVNVKLEPGLVNVKLEPGLVNVKLEPGLVNVKLEPGLVNVKIEPTFDYVTVKTEPEW